MAEDTGDLTAQAEETLAAEETPTRPEWLPEQYADEQAFANAHREAQRKISEQGNELARMREEMESLSDLIQEQPAQQQYGDVTAHPLVVQYANAMGVDTETAAQALGVHAQLTRTLFDQQMQEQAKQQAPDNSLEMALHVADEHLRAKHGEEYVSLATEIEAVVGANPRLLQGSKSVAEIEAGLETAFAVAQRDKLLAGRETSLAQQQAQTDLARQRKLDAETLSGTGTREASQDEQAALFARIKGMNTGGLRLGEQ